MFNDNALGDLQLEWTNNLRNNSHWRGMDGTTSKERFPENGEHEQMHGQAFYMKFAIGLNVAAPEVN